MNEQADLILMETEEKNGKNHCMRCNMIFQAYVLVERTLHS